MFKKIVFALLALIVVYSSAVVTFRIFEPKTDTNVVEESAYLDYDSLREYILSTGESVTHYLYFYSRLDNDCVYVKNTVLATVTADTQLQIDKIIETVDITSLEQNMTTGKLPNKHGIVGNGLYYRDKHFLEMWTGDNSVIETHQIWDVLEHSQQEIESAVWMPLLNTDAQERTRKIASPATLL